MNATPMCERLTKAIQAVENFRRALKQYPKESVAVLEMFSSIYPDRAPLIAFIAGDSAKSITERLTQGREEPTNGA